VRTDKRTDTPDRGHKARTPMNRESNYPTRSSKTSLVQMTPHCDGHRLHLLSSHSSRYESYVARYIFQTSRTFHFPARVKIELVGVLSPHNASCAMRRAPG
jgi:hypothetical protein